MDLPELKHPNMNDSTHSTSSSSTVKDNIQNENEFYNPNNTNEIVSSTVNIKKFEDNVISCYDNKSSSDSCSDHDITSTTSVKTINFKSESEIITNNITKCKTTINNDEFKQTKFEKKEVHIRALEDVKHKVINDESLNVSVDKTNNCFSNKYEFASTSKNNTINFCYNGITCVICNEKFTFPNKYKFHLKTIHLKTYSWTNHNDDKNKTSPKNTSKIKRKKPDEDHLKALKVVRIIKPFSCEICQKMCENPDHFEIYMWLN